MDIENQFGIMSDYNIESGDYVEMEETNAAVEIVMKLENHFKEDEDEIFL